MVKIRGDINYVYNVGTQTVLLVLQMVGAPRTTGGTGAYICTNFAARPACAYVCRAVRVRARARAAPRGAPRGALLARNVLLGLNMLTFLVSRSKSTTSIHTLDLFR